MLTTSMRALSHTASPLGILIISVLALNSVPQVDTTGLMLYDNSARNTADVRILTGEQAHWFPESHVNSTLHNPGSTKKFVRHFVGAGP